MPLPTETACPSQFPSAKRRIELIEERKELLSQLVGLRRLRKHINKGKK